MDSLILCGVSPTGIGTVDSLILCVVSPTGIGTVKSLMVEEQRTVCTSTPGHQTQELGGTMTVPINTDGSVRNRIHPRYSLNC